MKTSLLCLASAGLAAGATWTASSDGSPPSRSTDEILRGYVEDFRADRAASEPRTFGIRVAGVGEWTVYVTGASTGEGTWEVEIDELAPEEPTFVYAVDADTLAAIDAGRLNALTAQGKAFPGDASPMNVEWMPGAEEFDVNPFSFHFWTRGFPERVPFGRDLTRVVHRASNVVFYYQEGLRTVWSSLAPGQSADNGEGTTIQVPFPILAVVIAGRAQGEMDGARVEASKGEAIFIPPGTSYRWWNEDAEENAEVVLVMFGEGA